MIEFVGEVKDLVLTQSFRIWSQHRETRKVMWWDEKEQINAKRKKKTHEKKWSNDTFLKKVPTIPLKKKNEKGPMKDTTAI